MADMEITRGEAFEHTWNVQTDGQVYWQMFDTLSGWAGPKYKAQVGEGTVTVSLTAEQTSRLLTGQFGYRLYSERDDGKGHLSSVVLASGDVNVHPGVPVPPQHGTIWVIRDADGRIIAAGNGVQPSEAPPPGGRVENYATTLEAFLSRFRLSGPRQVSAQSKATVTVTVTCPERAGSSVWVLVNGSAEIEVELDANGVGALELDASAPTTYVIEPAEDTFAPLGSGAAIVEVVG